MSVEYFRPSPLFIGDGEYPDYAHRLDVYTPAEGAIVIVRRRGGDEYVAAGVSQIAPGETIPYARFVYLPEGLGEQSLRAVIIYATDAGLPEVRDWLSPYSDGDVPPPLYVIGNSAYKIGTTEGAERVVVMTTGGRLVGSVVPDELGGAWSMAVPEGVYIVLYYKEGCQPIAHGPYNIQSPDV